MMHALSRIFVLSLLAWLALVGRQALAQPSLQMPIPPTKMAQEVVVRPAAEATPNLAVLYFLDTQGQQTVDQIEQLPISSFLRFQRDKPISLGAGALWLRFAVADTSVQQGLRLTVPLATVDDVVLYNRGANAQWVAQYGGDKRPMSQWAQPGRYPSFVLSSDKRPVQYLMQIRQERGLYSTLPRVMSEQSYISSRQNEHTLLGMYFGLAALMVILALTRAAVYRDMGFASYAAYVAILALLLATINGLSALYLWPEFPISNTMSILTGTLTVTALLWFVRVTLRPKRFSRWLDFAVLAMIWLTPVRGLINIMQPSGWGYTFYTVMMLTMGVLILSTVAGALRQGDHDSRWVALGMSPIILVVIVLLSRNFGFIPSSALTELITPAASAIEVVILLYGLHSRMSQRRGVNTRITRLWKIDPLTGLDSRELLITKLTQVMSTARRKKEPYALLVMRVVNADAIETQRGREAADRALVVAASCIRLATQPNDVLARVGPTQFALLMENPVSESAANAAASRVLANVKSEVQGLIDDKHLIVDIAIGLHNPANDAEKRDAESIVSRVITAAMNMQDGWGKPLRLLVL